MRAMLVSMFVRQQAGPTVKTQNHDDLVALKALVEAGAVTPVIDRHVPASGDAEGDRARRCGTRSGHAWSSPSPAPDPKSSRPLELSAGLVRLA